MTAPRIGRNPVAGPVVQRHPRESDPNGTSTRHEVLVWDEVVKGYGGRDLGTVQRAVLRHVDGPNRARRRQRAQ